MGPETWFSSMGSLHLPLGVWRLITHSQLLAFTLSPLSDTVIKQQSLLISGYVHSNQLWLEVRVWERRERQNEGRKRHIITIFPYFSSTHMALIETHSHIRNNRHTHTHTQSVFLTPCPSLLCRPVWVILMGTSASRLGTICYFT